MFSALAVLSPCHVWAGTPMEPEAVRVGAPAQADSWGNLRTGFAAGAPPLAPGDIAPMPNRDIHAPAAPKSGVTVGPVWLKAETPYRGESFGSDSTSDPGKRDRHMPLPGFAVKLPLN
jgi:hypothetical protein